MRAGYCRGWAPEGQRKTRECLSSAGRAARLKRRAQTGLLAQASSFNRPSSARMNTRRLSKSFLVPWPLFVTTHETAARDLPAKVTDRMLVVRGGLIVTASM